MTTIHHLPKELIEMISDKLTSTKDLYTGLTVSRLWCACFCRSLYRHVHIGNRRQFRKWLGSLPQQHPPIRHISFGSYGSYRPDDYMNGSVPPSTIKMGVTLHELNTILSSLPLLESFHFDTRLWGYLKVQDIHIGGNLRSLPPLDHPRQFVMLTKNLTRLCLQGADIFRLHERHHLLPIFDQTPSLTHLRMDAGGVWEDAYRMVFSMKDMDTLHSKLPFLQELVMDDAVHLITSKGVETTPAMRLHRFQIRATCDSHAWFRYISRKYPALCSLGLNLIPEEEKAKEEELVTLVKSLDQLKSLSVHHDMGKLFIGNAFLTLVGNKKLYDLELGLFAVPSPSSLRLVGNKLHHLTLSCNKKSNMCYPIHSIFASCPHLVHLELYFGRIVEDPASNKLKNLRMHNVRMSSDTFFHGFPALESLFLRECIFDGKRVFPIDVRSSSMMETIILSELKVQDASDKLIFLKKEEKEVRWYKEMQHRDTFRFYLQRQLLDDVQECHVALGCRSVKSIIFNGCKI